MNIYRDNKLLIDSENNNLEKKPKANLKSANANRYFFYNTKYHEYSSMKD